MISNSIPFAYRAKEFAKMQTKVLSNGRLAMLAAAGFYVQELINGKGIFRTSAFKFEGYAVNFCF